MKKSLITLGILIVCCWLLGACQSNVAQTTPAGSPVAGAWEVKEVHWVTPDKTYSIDKAQPGIFIFTNNSYSIMWVPQGHPREPFNVLSKPSDAEAIAGFKSVVFNGGTYEYTDSTLTSTAMIAKVPGFEGGKQFYNYDINGDELRLTMFDETYPDGSKPDWSGKAETLFVLQRVEE